MRIRQLQLLKYGKFDGETLSFPKAEHDFHLVIGPNEAGKSTLRNAVLEWLFGMPARTPLAFRHELTELRLGGVLEGDGGETLFHRVRGRTQLRTPADDKLPDDHLAPWLGGVGKEFYEQMFSLDRDRLVEGGRSILDASKELGRVLFQSAAGIASLGPVRDALESRAGEIWARRGSSSEYAQAEARLAEASAALKASQVRTKFWSEARNSLEDVTEQIAAAEQERRQLETLRSRLERVRRVAPLLRELGSKEQQLGELGVVIELPPSAQADLAQAQADLAGAGRVLEERNNDLASRQSERQQITTDGDALALAADIEALDEARGACVKHPRDLPLREAEVAHLLAQAAEAARQLGWPTDEPTLRRHLPSALALKTVNNLLRERGALHQAMSGAQEAATERARELQGLREQLGGLAGAPVPEALRQAHSAALGLRHSGGRQRALQADAEQARRQLDDALLALGRWATSVPALRCLAPPSRQRVAALQREDREQVLAVDAARGRLEEADAALRRLQLEAQQFAERHQVVSSADVQHARAARDQAWGEVKDGQVAPAEAGPAVDAAIHRADALVDARLGSATEAATLQGMREQAEQARLEQAGRQEALSQRDAALLGSRSTWTSLATALGLPGMDLDDLPDWLERREAVFAAEAQWRQCQAALDTERTGHSEAASALRRALHAAAVPMPLPVATPESDDLDALAATAAGFMQQADAAHTQKQALERQLVLAESSLQTLRTRSERATADHQAWEAQWQQALQAARLSAASTTLAQAGGAVDLANTVAERLAAADEIRRGRIDAMHADLDLLVTEADRIATLLGQAPAPASAAGGLELARQLATRLRSARSAAQAAAQADGALREATARRSAAERDAADARARIHPLLVQAGVDSVELALPLAARSDTRRALVQAIDAATSSLFREGDGLSREAIEAELAEHEPTAAIAALDQARRDLAAVGERLNGLLQRQVTAQQAFDAINGQADAASAEARRQESLAAMGEAAEQYLEMATASRLLKWAIDRYRDRKQGPMLQRAGAVFTQLTLGQFSKLVVDHEADPPTLYARRHSGKQVEVSGLSEGTRDQLFLALRIAALELHLQHAPALPFIADDLFVNFDNRRAHAGLQALRELSRHTQVLFLTHHEHLLPMVHEVFGAAASIAALRREADAA